MDGPPRLMAILDNPLGEEHFFSRGGIGPALRMSSAPDDVRAGKVRSCQKRSDTTVRPAVIDSADQEKVHSLST